VSAFIDLMKDLKKQTDRPTVFLFGDMRELGEEASETHNEIAEKLPGVMQYVYLVGPLTEKYVLPILKKSKRIKEVKWFPDAVTAGKYLAEHLPKDALVQVKGSQNTIYLEEAIKSILADPDHERYLTRQDNYWRT